MAMQLRIVLLLNAALCLQLFLLPVKLVGAYYYRGEATYNGPYYSPSACYGDDAPYGNELVAAVSSSLFENGAACGALCSVTCRGASDGGFNPCSANPTVVVTVVDVCPACVLQGGLALELSLDAFAQIANPAHTGVINVEFSLFENF